MIDGAFRQRLPGFVQPLLRLYRRLGLHPNHLSLIGLTGGLATALAIAAESFLLAIGLWWLGRLFDGTDGIYARETGQSSPFGAYLDIVCDMAAYSLVMLAFAFVRPELCWSCACILALYVLCITSALAYGSQLALSGIAATDNRGLRLGAGLAEAGETGIAYTCFLLFPGQLSWLLKLWVIILVVTVVSRSIIASRDLAASSELG